MKFLKLSSHIQGNTLRAHKNEKKEAKDSETEKVAVVYSTK